MADSNGAMLIGSGAVQINGELGPHSSTVFNGDKIQTSADASALIKSPNAMLSIGSGSAITYEGSSINFERGTVIVDTPKGMSARFGDLTISSNSDKPVKFELVNADGAEKVVVLSGAVKISDGAHLAKLNAGQAMVRMAYETSNDKSAEDLDSDGPQHRNANAQTIGDESGPVASNIPGWTLVLVTFAPIAAIGAIGVAGGFNTISTVSPSTVH